MAKSNKPIYPVYEEELNELSYRPDGFFDRLLNFSLNKLTNPVKLPYSFFIPVSEYLRGSYFVKMSRRQWEIMNLPNEIL